MFIAIVGTPSSGKRSLLNYLVQRHGFREVGLERTADVMEGAKLVGYLVTFILVDLRTVLDYLDEMPSL